MKFWDSFLAASDEQLMWRLQSEDDEEAFAQIVKRWEQRIYALCGRMIDDPARAEDLSQETFLRLFDRRKQFRTDARLGPWLRRIALNICHDELRRRRSRAEGPLSPDDLGDEDRAVDDGRPQEGRTPDFLAAMRDESELVRTALAGLPEIYRTVLVLRHYEGLKLREIADLLELPQGTVNSRLAEALDQLSRRLRPRFDEFSIVRATSSRTPKS